MRMLSIGDVCSDDEHSGCEPERHRHVCISVLGDNGTTHIRNNRLVS